MVDSKLVEVVTPVIYSSFFKDIFSEVSHITGVIRSMTATINQKYIDFLPIIQ